MNRSESEVEVLPSPAAIVRARSGIDKAELDRLVQIRVAEIMAERDAFAFEPFFRSRQIAYELKRLQTMPEQRKWTVYFERFGCLICETRKVIHVGNGMCGKCYARVFNSLKQIIAEGVSGQTAQPAAGTPQAERRLPIVRTVDAPHHCWLARTSEDDKDLYGRVARKVGVSVHHVRSVDRGRKHSEVVGKALKNECRKRRTKISHQKKINDKIGVTGRACGPQTLQ